MKETLGFNSELTKDLKSQIEELKAAIKQKDKDLKEARKEISLT